MEIEYVYGSYTHHIHIYLHLMHYKLYPYGVLSSGHGSPNVIMKLGAWQVEFISHQIWPPLPPLESGSLMTKRSERQPKSAIEQRRSEDNKTVVQFATVLLIGPNTQRVVLGCAPLSMHSLLSPAFFCHTTRMRGLK